VKDPTTLKEMGNASGAAKELAHLALLSRKRVASRVSGSKRAKQQPQQRATEGDRETFVGTLEPEPNGVVFPIDASPKGLPKNSGILALVDGDTLLVQIVSPEERAALKAQFRQTTPELTAGEAEVLRQGGASAAELRMGPALWALARGSSEVKYQNLLDASLDVEQAASRLGVTAGRIRQLLGTKRLYGVKLGSDWRIPSFQLLSKGLVPDIGEVVAVLRPELGLLAVYNWFTTPNADLRIDDEDQALTPLAWLRSGHSPRVAAALAAEL
jgi:excisionase family DNA binding protein